jgi:tripartite-type tricarboxylate transporter receptor subunit TctC
MHRSFRRVAGATLAVATALLAGGAFAQAWPQKPVRFIVPNAPGGGLDIVARLLAAKMTDGLGQTVLVDNKPGASTMVGTEIVAKAPPDGYTMGLITDSHSINPNFVAKLPYDSIRDFEPISQLVDGYYVLAATPSLGWKTVGDFIAAAKARPGKVTYSSAGSGSPHHLTMEWLRTITQVDINHVPYKGVAPAVADVIAGHVNAVFSGPPTALPHAASGKLVALAVTSPKRLASAPSIPTMVESGFPEFVASFWYGLIAPAGTPRDVVQRLNREVGRALAQPDVRERLATLGLEPTSGSTPEAFGAFMKKDAVKYTTIIKMSGAKGE